MVQWWLTRMMVMAVAVGVSGALWADPILPKIFSSNMVMQRGRPLPVWGTAAPGEKITVELAGQSASATADAQGRWQLRLPAQEAGGPAAMVVSGATATVRCENILFGDVWVCSGQSNMEWRTKNSHNAAEALPAALQPQIRLFDVTNNKAVAPLPLTEFEKSPRWLECTPESVAEFSAVGYFFGAELQRELGVPIGLISSSWGGTRIEPWTPECGFADIAELTDIRQKVALANPASAPYQARLRQYLADTELWLTEARQALAAEKPILTKPDYPQELVPLTGNREPTTLFNAMIAPMVPYAICGAIWYQGESNRHDGPLYFYKKQALIGGWRQLWGQGDFPFYWVQLAPYNYGASQPYVLPRMQVTQTSCEAIANTGQVVINDVGNIKDIHPRDKVTVGKRLATLALKKHYDRDVAVWSGPVCVAMTVADGKARLRFEHVGSGLVARDDKPLSHFELCGAKGIFVPAEAAIVGAAELEVSAAGVDAVHALRFAWEQLAEPNLMNREGWPAGPFVVGEVPVTNDLQERIPEAAGYHPLYVLDIAEKPNYHNEPVPYVVDRSKDFGGMAVERIAYCLELQKDGQPLQYVFVSMDAFTQNLAQMGVPTAQSEAFFQQNVTGMTIAANVPGVPTGMNLNGGNIEFWPSNYGPQNQANVPNASASAFDFGDGGGKAKEKGYGCLQIHNYEKKCTLIAFNRWGGGTCELGLGNSPQGNLDWTFTSNAGQYSLRRLTVLVQLR